MTNRLLSQQQQNGIGTQPEGPSLHTAEDDLDVQKEKERVEALAEEVHETGRNMPLVVRDLAKVTRIVWACYGRDLLKVFCKILNKLWEIYRLRKCSWSN